MKTKTTLRNFLALAGSSIIAASPASAATLYWDNNGATAGFGTAAGTWESTGTVGSATLGWGTDVTGVIAPTGTITTLNTNSTTDALNFGTVAAGLAAGTITVNGNVSAGNITFGSASGAVVLSGGTITLTAAQTTTVNNTTDTIGSILAGAGTSFTKAGTGTLILTGANSYTGTTIIRGGTINLGNSSTTGSLASTALELQGGTLNYTRTDSQTKNFSTTAIKTGASSVTANAGNTLGLADITRSAGGTLAVGTTGTITTSDANDATGILGAWAFYGTQYATGGGTIAGYSGGAATIQSDWTSATTNYEVTTTTTQTLGASRTANTLRYSTGNGLTIALGSGSNTLTTNGILAVGTGTLTISGTGTTSLIAGSTNEIVIAGSQTVTISAPISSGAVTYSGTGQLTLSGANTYAGGFTLNSGRVFAAAGTYAGFGSGTLTVTGGSITATNSDVVTINNNLNWSGSLLIQRSGGSSGTPTITFNNPVALSSDVKLLLSSNGVTTAGSAAFTNNISGAYGINVVSDGPTSLSNTLTLSGTNNTFSGGLSLTPIKGMFLNINSATALGATAGTFTIGSGGVVTIDNTSAAAITLANNNPLAFNNGFTFTGTRDLNMGTGAVNLGGAGRTITVNGGTFTLGGVISNGGLTKAGAGTLVLSGTNTYTGATAISAGTLSLTGSLTGTAVATSATGIVDQSAAGAIAGAGVTFAQGSSGISTLAGTNTYTGATTVSAGTLSLTGSLTGTAVATSATGIVNQSAAGSIAGAVAFTQGSSGTSILSGTNSYTGATTISAGTLSVGATSNLGASAANLVFNGGTLQITGTALTNFSGIGHTVSFTAAKLVGLDIANAAHTFTVDQILNQTTGGFTKAGLGTVVLNQANTFSGTTTINGGILTLTNALALQNSAYDTTGSNGTSVGLNVTSALSSGNLTLGGLSGAVDLAGAFTAGFTGSVSNLTLNTAGAGPFTYTGAIANGTMSLTKTGTGTQVLSGSNTYTGITTVSDGTLRLGSANALSGGIGATGGTSALTISTTGVVELGAGNFQRNLGTGISEFQMTAGGTNTSGFSAFGGPRVITVNNNASQELVWGSGGFNPGKFLLNATTANNSLELSNRIDLSAATRTVVVNADKALLSGVIRTASGTAGLTKEGVGTLVLSGANTYNGPTTIIGGTLSVGASNNLGASAANLVFDGGTLQITGTALTNFSGIGHTVSFNATKLVGLDIANAAHTFTVNQVLNQTSGGFTKSGVGTLVLNQNNTYTGATTATGGGTLVLDYSTNNGSKIGNAALNLSGGNLVLRGNSAAPQAVTSIVIAANTGNSISRDSSTTTIANAGVLTMNGNTNLTISEAGIVSTTTANAVVSGVPTGIQSLGQVTVGSHFATNVSNVLQAYSSYISYAAVSGNITGGGVGSPTINPTDVNQLTGGGTLTSTLNSYALRIFNNGDSNVLTLGNSNLNFINGGTLLYAGGSDGIYTINGGGTGTIKPNSGGQPLNMNIFTGTLTVNANLAVPTTFSKGGAGTLVAGGANTISGAIYIQQGVFRLANATGLGTTAGGTIVQGGAALELSQTTVTPTDITVGAEALSINGTGISNGGALRNHSGNNTYGGLITIGASGARINSNASTTLTLTGGIATTLTQDVTFGGAGNTTVSTTAITGSGNLIKDGAGTLTLTATNTYTGATTVTGTGSKLIVNGSISTSILTTVQIGATLGGSGSVGALTIDSGGFFSPGNSPGITTVNGNYIQNGSLVSEITGLTAGTLHDQVVVNGTVTLNGLLSLTMNTFTPVADNLVFLLLNDSNDAITGTFTGLANGAVAANYGGFDWTISYFGNSATSAFTGGNDVVLKAVTAIPEPGAALLGSLGLLALLRRRR